MLTLVTDIHLLSNTITILLHCKIFKTLALDVTMYSVINSIVLVLLSLLRRKLGKSLGTFDLRQGGQHTWKYLGIPGTFFYTSNYLENPYFSIFDLELFSIFIRNFIIPNLKLLNFYI